MKWPWNRHRCSLPDVPSPYSQPHADWMRFTCPQCGQDWRLEWFEDIVEYTIAAYADIGYWTWRKMP